MTLNDLYRHLFKVVANEPLVVAAAVVAAVNATGDHTPKGYVVAGVMAALRFVVTGPLSGSDSQTAP